MAESFDTILPAGTEKICPLLSSGVEISGNTVNNGTKCIGTACQFWVPNTVINEEEGEQNLKDHFSTNTGMPDGNRTDGSPDLIYEEGGIATVDIADGAVGRCGLVNSDFNENIYRILYHWHRNHIHQVMHDDNVLIHHKEKGPMQFTPPMLKSQMFSMEAAAGEDINNDNIVYGKDFTVAKSPDKPYMLNNIDESQMYRTPYYKVPWESAENNQFPPMVKRITPNIIYTQSIEGDFYYMKIIGGFFQSFKDHNFNISNIKLQTEDGTEIININNKVIFDDKLLYIKIPVGDLSVLNSYEKLSFSITNTVTNIIAKIKGGTNILTNYIQIKNENMPSSEKIIQNMIESEYNEFDV